ncbi:MarR family winged helix-turn-helix transcriptional regulator [Bacillus horti]|uniref:DNA-binding MarR family transcriptional regulator n=1 Tax=Caldalkalibacillus horti TaxID=77523 RepID=A0ABT9W0Z7_9BACI|nr:MarR family transcriptional regulator [Bacillus horti]MDQ0166515.1 DNA-binding MarR family transcriptional regulator [Bacillus horti]
MKSEEQRKKEISNAFLGAVYAYTEYEKETHFLKTKDGKQIYYAEIHLISTIKENEGIHITGLADKLGVTIGAVSQLLIKLERKGLIQKEKDPKNQSRFLIKLTTEGEKTHENHLKFHEEFDSLLFASVQGEPKEKVDFLERFLLEVCEKLEKKIKK